MSNQDDRYQYQPWYIKLWRRRWYLLVPFEAMVLYIKSDESFENCWSISIGMADVRMNWLYHFNEIDRE